MDVIVDDSIKHVENSLAKHKFLVVQDWNEHIQKEGINSVDSFDEILDYIKGVI